MILRQAAQPTYPQAMAKSIGKFIIDTLLKNGVATGFINNIATGLGSFISQIY